MKVNFSQMVKSELFTNQIKKRTNVNIDIRELGSTISYKGEKKYLQFAKGTKSIRK